MAKPLAMSKMKEGAIWLPNTAPSPKPVGVNSPAIEVMTDLRQVAAVTVSPGETIIRATHVMIARRVRLLLVANASGLIEGLLSARDTMGEKPIQLLENRRGSKYDDLIVADLMVPRPEIDVLDFELVLRSEVGAVIETLKESGRQHALVVETDTGCDMEVVRGIFSATQIARQLGVALPIFEVARTFAEITSALQK